MIRLILIILFAAISLLAVCKAPTYHLWMLAIAVTEFPYLFCGILLILLLSGIWMHKYQLTGTLIGLAALFLFLSPVVRAYRVARDLPSQLEAAFVPGTAGDAPLMPDRDATIPAAPFRWTRMLSGMKAPTVSYDTYTYKQYGDTALTLDFYPSQVILPLLSQLKFPCIVVIHGGSWGGGASQQLPELNSFLSLEGYNVATINYRLAPRYQSPAPVEDLAAALAFLRQRSEALRIDTTRFVLLGRSAGAQIALLAAYTLPRQIPGSGIKGVISFYGPADMVWGYSLPANPLVMDSRKVMEEYLGGTYRQVPQNYFASSPIAAVTRESVPTLLIHGQNDVIVAYEHSTRLAKKLQENNVPHFLLTLPWATHGCDFTLNGPSGQLSTYTVETFLKLLLGTHLAEATEKDHRQQAQDKPAKPI